MTSSELGLLLFASVVAWLAGHAKSYVVDVIIKHKPKGNKRHNDNDDVNDLNNQFLGSP